MATLLKIGRRQRLCLIAALGTIVACAGPASADDAAPEDQRPLSPAQVALFETPHLQNVGQVETLDYKIVRDGPGGFTDKVALHVRGLHADGTKDLSFDFLTGERRVAYPELDNFRGNPLLMLVLERDVLEMKATLGVSATYFRNEIRQSFVDRATIVDSEFTLDGKAIPVKLLSVHPFANDSRLEHLPTVQSKAYLFVLSDKVPGTIAEIRIEMPGNDEQNIPAVAERITFQGVEP